MPQIYPKLQTVTTVLNFLPGKKTYIIGVASVLWGAASAWMSDLGPLPMAEDPMQMIMTGLGLLGLRKGMEG